MASGIIVGLFTITFLLNCRIIHGGGYSSLTNKESSNCMKGMAALLIVFSHAHFYSTDFGLLKLFKPFGFIGVSLFFFYSGYGVMCQYISNVKYLNGFLLKRFRSVYIPYLIATLMYTFFVRNQNVSYTLLIKNIFLMDRVLPFAWYVPVILVWYLLFFEVLKLINDPKRACVIFLCVNILWYILGYLLELSSFYYNSTICLTLGCFVALKEEKICRVLSKMMSLTVVTIAFVLSIILLAFGGGKSDLAYSICVIIASFTTIVFLLSLGTKIEFNGAIPRILGSYSYEIYLTQGIAYSLSRQMFGNQVSLFWVCFLLILAMTSVILQFLVKAIKSRKAYRSV